MTSRHASTGATPDDQATRLIDEAATAVRDAHEIDTNVPEPMRPLLRADEWKPEARAAVVAALRMLDADGYVLEDQDWHRTRPGELADRIDAARETEGTS